MHARHSTRSGINRYRIGLLVLGGTLCALLATQSGEAHKKVTSRFNYNDHVFPIFRARCSQCHVKDGVAPMSLVTYQDAFPWAESLRLELLAAELPSEPAAPASLTNEKFVKTAHTRLSPREFDTVMEWATGGTPQGNLDQQLPVVTLRNEWTLGAPDVALQLPAALTVGANDTERTEQLVLGTKLTKKQMVKTIDVVPGNPSILREAVVCLKSTAACTPDAPGVLAVWYPGLEKAVPIKDGQGVELPAKAELVVRMRYKKSWQHEGMEVSDRSTVGLYFNERATSSR